ncbi:Ig-like domain-containing protein [Hymenobacter qilianensis]|uniref:Ig-like domain-containing protein n=1 Tax=Hymenobacter qilianensis TaxID=1385715 RepID=A0A7H0H161_9BACT|nr:Ig-like domain-containing protein [Hymenobacter qilianensis]QNP54277.1 Ig-like domain-containing protein [Hymenobacter qilianensis]
MQLATDSVRLGTGQTVQLQALARDARGNALSDRLITWQSAQESTATVSSTGLVSLVREGTTSITATCEGRTATAHVRAYALLPRYAYVSFQQVSSQLQPWAGEHLVLLTPESDRDPRLMQRLVASLDGGYAYYRLVTGREPSRHPTYTYQGKGTVASVAQTCGVACGKIGATGIEMMHPWVTDLYAGVRDKGEHRTTLFYELGRNFWFYWDPLYVTGMKLDVATGYAHLMKYMATDYLRLPLSPIEAQQRRGLEEIATVYLRSPEWDWQRVVRSGQALDGEGKPVGGQFLLAGLLLRLQAQHGGQGFIQRLWREVGQRPHARSEQEAIDNLALAIYAGANQNLGQVLTQQWRFALSGAAQQEAQTRFGNPR